MAGNVIILAAGLVFSVIFLSILLYFITHYLVCMITIYVMTYISLYIHSYGSIYSYKSLF